MSAVTLLVGVVVALLLPVLYSLARHRTLGALALRNLRRRRGEAGLVIAGSLLGTAIITSAFVVGDIVDGSITDVARTQLGPVDVQLAPADPADREAVRAAVEAADLDAVEGVLPAARATVALEAGVGNGDHGRALPSTSLLELDVEGARAFGSDPAITGLDDPAVVALGTDGIVLNDRTAQRLEVAAGDVVRVHAYGSALDLTVRAVVDEVGLAGFGGAIVAPGTFDALLATATVPAAPPEPLVLVSLDGGVFDTRELSATAVEDLRAAVAAIPGVSVDAVKADLLETAEREGSMFAELFTTIGAFSVLAGILLLVNLFVMLAEERKTELGMLRALGFTRRRLTHAFAIEGALYAVLAAAVGTVVGIGVGWIVARTAGAIFGIAEQGLVFRLVVEPASLAVGGLTGLAMSLVTIWLTSLRIARLNVIRAIRDLPEPKLGIVRPRTLVLGAVGVLTGAGLTAAGIAGEEPFSLLLGVPVAAFSSVPLLRRLLPERTARLLPAAGVITWGIAAFTLFPDVLGQADLPLFVAQGVVLTAGAVAAVSTLDLVWSRAVDLLSSRGRGLAARLGIAYPLARRFRTSMLLSMFSLVIFTMTFIAAMATMFDTQAETFTDEARGGFDVTVTSNAANPVATKDLLARDEIVAVAGLSRSFARFDTWFTDEPRGWTISGFDEDLIAGGPPPLTTRDDRYASDDEAYAAVLADPSLTIVSDTFLQDGGPAQDRVRVGDRVDVLDPVSGAPISLTVAGVSGVDWLFNGALVSRELTGALFGPQDVIARHYLAVADGVDAAALAADLDLALLANGADAATFASLVAEGLRQQNAFLTLLQAFLGLGLLVGIAGLGVVMVRAVHERRQEIGMLRAMGLRAGLVRSAFLSEAGVIALQGTIIGSVLGLVTARQVFQSSDAFGTMSAAFTIPWTGLVVIALLPIVASLAATAWPAARAAAIRPAVALRVTE
jgi:putative ABC transport system permease protein